MAIRVMIDTNLAIPATKDFPEATTAYVDGKVLILAKEAPEGSSQRLIDVAGFPLDHVVFWEAYETSRPAWQIDADRKPDTVSVG